MVWLRNHFNLFSAVLFQLAWFSAVIGRESFILVTTALLVVHFLVTPTVLKDVKGAGIIALIGILADSTLSALNIFDFAQQALIPVWLILLWLHLGAALPHGFAFMKKLKTWQVCLIGAVAGPVSYFAGFRLGAVELPYGVIISCGLLSLIWLLLLPVFVLIIDRITAFEKPCRVQVSRTRP
jgi:hypothetical protein